eukprot:COSAG02_NODE_12625_length_1517_cov_5.677010_1_plen_117_part_00
MKASFDEVTDDATRYYKRRFDSILEQPLFMHAEILNSDHWPQESHPEFEDYGMGMLPPTVRERGLLRYSARQRAPSCFYTSYSVYLAAAGTRTYAPPPPQPRGAPSAAPSSVRRSP